MAIDNRLLIMGAGGHAKVVIDAARTAGWNPVAALDRIGPGGSCCGVPVIGTEDHVQAAFDEGLRAAVVAIGNNVVRTRIGVRLMALGFNCPAIIHPAATVSSYAMIEFGAVVMAGAVINPAASVGRFAIINTNATVEHDCIVGEGAHVGPRAVMGGDARIGDGVLLGIGGVIKPQANVGRYALIGAGAVVVSDIPEGVEAIGVPARCKSSS